MRNSKNCNFLLEVSLTDDSDLQLGEKKAGLCPEKSYGGLRFFGTRPHRDPESVTASAKRHRRVSRPRRFRGRLRLRMRPLRWWQVLRVPRQGALETAFQIETRTTFAMHYSRR